MRAFWFAALLLAASAAGARPYSIDDVMRLESYGNVSIDPSERWAVIERRGPYEAAPRFDYAAFTRLSLSKLLFVDLTSPGRLDPFFAQDADAGYWSGGFSPSGRRLAVFRLKADVLSLGVVDMASGEVNWLALPPDLPNANRVPAWISDDELVYIARPSGGLPTMLDFGSFVQRRTAEEWHRLAGGQDATVSLFGSGAYRDVGLAEGGRALVRVNVRTGSMEVEGEGLISDVALSPDGRRAAILMVEAANQPPAHEPVRSAFQSRRQRLVVRELGSERVWEPCALCDVLPNLLSWSPTGDELLFYARTGEEEWEEGSLYRFSLARGLREAGSGLEAEVEIVGGSASVVRAGWAGQDPIVVARRLGTQEAPAWYRLTSSGPRNLTQGSGHILAATRDASYLLANGRLVRRTASGDIPVIDAPLLAGSPQRLDAYLDGARLMVNPPRDQIRAISVGAGDGAAARGLDLEAGRPTWTAHLPARDARLVAAGGRSGATLSLTSSTQGTSTLWLSTPSRAPIVLDSINAHLADVELTPRIAIRSPAPNGGFFTHWLTMPPNASGRVPLVVIPYPGFVRSSAYPPQPARDLVQAVVNPALLAAAGYAVLEPSIPRRPQLGDLSAGYTEFANVTPEDLASDDPFGRMTDILLGAVDAAIATGRVDRDRVAIYGHSFGAYSALAAASRTDRFDAVVAVSGAYDLLASYGRLPVQADQSETGLQLTMPFGFFETGQGGLGVPPWRAAREYVRRSPFYSVEDIWSPVLLIQGELDYAPYSEAERMFMALFRLGRDAVLLRYGGEGHLFASPANMRDQWRRTLAFLSEHLASPDASEPPVTGPSLEAREDADHAPFLAREQSPLVQ